MDIRREGNPLMFFVNGMKVIDEHFDLEWSLADYLRRKLHLTGTKIGCNEGGCGACTVMVSCVDPACLQETSPRTVKHMSVNACLVPLPWIHGQAVTTIEGIGSTRANNLHAVQKQLADSHGTQCGFCTPGFVMSMYTLLRTRAAPTYQDMLAYFQGNLCRCTGYRPILQAYKSFLPDDGGDANGGCCRSSKDTNGCCRGNIPTLQAFPAAAGDDDFSNCCSDGEKSFLPVDESQEPIFPPELLVRQYVSRSWTFIGKRVSWFQPSNSRQLLALKSNYPDGKIVGGNTEIGIDVRQKGAFHAVYINPRWVPETNVLEISLEKGCALVGASVTLSRLRDTLAEFLNSPDISYHQKAGSMNGLVAIVEMLDLFSGQQIRNVATLVGNIVTCSPISDLNPLLAAMGTKLILKSFSNNSAGREVVLDSAFFTGYRKNSILPNEVVESIWIPLGTRVSQKNVTEFVKGFKVATRRDDDIAVLNAGFRVVLDSETSDVRHASLWFGGAAAVTKEAESAVTVMIGKKWDLHILDEVIDALGTDIEIPDDAPGGKASYRKTMITSFFFKFWLEVSHSLSNPEEKWSNDEMGLSPLGALKAAQIFPKVPDAQKNVDPVGRPVPHSTAYEQVTGEANFLDDSPRMTNELHLAPVLSTKACSKIKSLDFSKALLIPGVRGVLSEADVLPGKNFLGPVVKDDAVFHSTEVSSCGQIIAAVVAETPELAREAVKHVRVLYEEENPSSSPILTIEDAIAQESYFFKEELCNGDISGVMSSAPFVLSGETRVGGQEHFYLEPQASLAIPKGEKGEMEIIATTQWPGLVQEQVADLLDIPSNRVVVKVKRLGGAFGGKELKNYMLALPCALAAQKYNCPVRCVLNRMEDMKATGQRHGYLGKYRVAFNSKGQLLGLDLQLYHNAGYSQDVSVPLMQSSMLRCCNSYKIPVVRVRGFSCKTNLPSNTAMRAAGVMQPLIICEQIVQRVAEELKMDPNELRKANLLRTGTKTHYGKVLEDCTLEQCWDECLLQSKFFSRKAEVNSFNKLHDWKKRGISMVPVMFGLAFPGSNLNQAGALVMIYKDGSVLISHAGVEIGQGIHVKLAQIASRVLDIPLESIHTADTATDKIPNATSTAASFTTDLNGPAVKKACEKLVEKLRPYKHANPQGGFKDWVQAAYMDRVSLSATGFHKTPGLSFDWITKTGNPTSYYTYGVGCSEVEVDTLTGEHQILRTDIVMDIGESLNPAVDIGQIEGAFVQGYGMWMMEDLEFSPSGELRTAGPSNYKIPTSRDVPQEFNVSLLKGSANKHAIYSSKGVGEPPMFLSASVLFAAREAINSRRKQNGIDEYLRLDTPATGDKLRLACGDWLIREAKKTGKNSWRINI